VIFGAVKDMNGRPIIVFGVFLAIWTRNGLKIEKDVFEAGPFIHANISIFLPYHDTIGTFVWWQVPSDATVNKNKKERNVNTHDYSRKPIEKDLEKVNFNVWQSYA
jgi:hypothetical protein